MLLLVVIYESGGCVVVATSQHAGRCLFFLDYLRSVAVFELTKISSLTALGVLRLLIRVGSIAAL